MSRVIYVPQYPTPMRYQEWWWWTLPTEFADAGMSVKILGAAKAEEMKHRRGQLSMFSPIDAAIELECAQIEEYMDLRLKDDDILFMSDLSFPGLFGNVLFHKRPKRCFAYCHATSLNTLDYFEKDRVDKFPVESSHANMMNTVFVGSNYHENKLGWNNTLVVRLPYPPLKFFRGKKENFIVSASRPTAQKVDIDLEVRIEEKLNWPIIRKNCRKWEEYYSFLSKSKILLISAHEDTFGYQIVDAVLNGCIPLAPNRCAYPEILPPECIYNDEEDLLEKLRYILKLEVMPPTPELLCHQEMEDFYRNIIQVMKGEVKEELPF